MSEELPFPLRPPCGGYLWWSERWQDRLCQRCGRWEFHHSRAARGLPPIRLTRPEYAAHGRGEDCGLEDCECCIPVREWRAAKQAQEAAS